MNYGQFLKYKFREFVPEKTWDLLAKTQAKRRERQFSETIRIINETPPRHFIIRRRPPGAGLFSNVNHVLQGVIRSKDLNLIPVVDMENYWTWYNRNYFLCKTDNSWGYFFRPVTSNFENKIEIGDSYILSSGDRLLHNHWLSDQGLRFMLDRKKISYLKKLVEEHVSLNEYVTKVLDKCKQEIAWDPENTLTIFYRGTEYTERKPPRHARQPSKDEILAKLNESEIDSNTRLFLATEDSDLRDVITSKYGKKRVYPEFKKSDTFEEILIEEIPNFRSSDLEMNRTYGYLIQTYLSAESAEIIASIANGSAYSFILNGNKYRKSYVFDLGTY